jgi:Domain of unknown function (DUF4249)
VEVLMRRILHIAVLTLLTACMREPTPLEFTGEQLMLHSMLVPGDEAIHVLLERASPQPRKIDDPVQLQPFSGALVEATVAGTTLVLEEAPTGFEPCSSRFYGPVPEEETIGPGCYVATVPGGLQPGQEYRLRVSLDGAVVAEGEATVPGFPEVLRPEAGDHHRVLGEPVFNPALAPGILVRYNLPEELTGVRVSLVIDSLFVGDRREPEATCGYNPFEPVERAAPVDSTVFLLRSLHCIHPNPQGGAQNVIPDSAFAHLRLAAFDSAYVSYHEATGQDSAERSRLSAGVTGALGVFAGGSSVTLPVVLLPLEP